MLLGVIYTRTFLQPLVIMYEYERTFILMLILFKQGGRKSLDVSLAPLLTTKWLKPLSSGYKGLYSPPSSKGTSLREGTRLLKICMGSLYLSRKREGARERNGVLLGERRGKRKKREEGDVVGCVREDISV